MTSIGKNKPARSGFTLVEIVAVIAIIGVVMGVSALSFTSWRKKNNIESQTRELFTVFMEARNNSFMQKKAYEVVLEPNNYVLRSYSSEGDVLGSNLRSKNLTYTLTKNGTSASVSGLATKFDLSGYTTTYNTIVVNPVDAAASLNCLVVYATRINMGKMNGTTCEFK